MKDDEYINSAAGGGNNSRLPPNGLYLNAHQTRDRKPTTYENILADAIEFAYATGIHDLDKLVESLNQQNCLDPDGNAWTDRSFTKVMGDLAA
jgi:hypothetical protein